MWILNEFSWIIHEIKWVLQEFKWVLHEFKWVLHEFMIVLHKFNWVAALCYYCHFVMTSFQNALIVNCHNLRSGRILRACHGYWLPVHYKLPLKVSRYEMNFKLRGPRLYFWTRIAHISANFEIMNIGKRVNSSYDINRLQNSNIATIRFPTSENQHFFWTGYTVYTLKQRMSLFHKFTIKVLVRLLH